MGRATENQLSRYGGMSKDLPFTTGKTFFLVNANEFALQEFQNKYPVDSDGTVRVFTTWATVITAIQGNTDYDAVIVSPLFTTAPTVAQVAALDAAGAVVWQAGQLLPDGSYISAKIGTSIGLQAATSLNIFQVNGRVKILQILGQVETTIGAGSGGANFTFIPTVGATTVQNFCATSNIAALPVGAQLGITGTLSAALVVATTSGLMVAEAAPVIIKAGIISFTQPTTTTGFVSFKVSYQAIDPGAFIVPL